MRLITADELVAVGTEQRVLFHGDVAEFWLIGGLGCAVRWYGKPEHNKKGQRQAGQEQRFWDRIFHNLGFENFIKDTQIFQFPHFLSPCKRK
jgi:hypothetical protein